MNGPFEDIAIDAVLNGRAERKKPRATNDTRPLIRIVAGEIERIVDESEKALVSSGRGLYQRDNRIVFVGSAPVITAHGRQITTQRIFERGDHALLEDLTCAATFERYDARAKEVIAANPPMSIVRTLQQRVGKLRFPILSGVISAPTLRADGTLLQTPGYDAETGLLYDPLGVDFPAIPDRPTRAEAERALALLNGLIATFPFVSGADRSVALSAILTALVRRSLPTAPLHALSAPVAGSGKSTLVDIASIAATGQEAGVIAQGVTEEEFEKRLGAVLLAGDPIVSIDNCERPLAGELLCQLLTQPRVRTRVLGKSETPEVSTGAFVAATGNNLLLVGDLTRRALLCRLDPKVERPEMREFDRDPIAIVKEHRSAYVVAALTVLRTFRVAGLPGKPKPLGSFEAWSNLVRGALLWLGADDPVDTMGELRKNDPRLDDLQAVISQWSAVLGSDRVTAAEVIKQAVEMKANLFDGSRSEFVRPDFREALLAVAGQGGAVNSRRLGKWLTANKQRIVHGVCFEHVGDRQGVAVWSARNNE